MEVKKTMVALERFKEEVAVWKYKGHDDVVRVEFHNKTIELSIRDYVYPDKAYYILMIDYERVEGLIDAIG